MLKKRAFIFVLLVTSIFNLYSEDKDDNTVTKENLSSYIGGAAGFTTGYGLSYRSWSKEIGWQVVFTPFSSGGDVTINLGSGLLKTLHKTEYTRLFLFLAGNGTYVNRSDYETNARVQEAGFAVGLGPGIEFYLFKNIAIDIMFGYRYSTGDAALLSDELGFTAEAALYYRF